MQEAWKLQLLKAQVLLVGLPNLDLLWPCSAVFCSLFTCHKSCIALLGSTPSYMFPTYSSMVLSDFSQARCRLALESRINKIASIHVCLLLWSLRLLPDLIVKTFEPTYHNILFGISISTQLHAKNINPLRLYLFLLELLFQNIRRVHYLCPISWHRCHCKMVCVHVYLLIWVGFLSLLLQSSRMSSSNCGGFYWLFTSPLITNATFIILKSWHLSQTSFSLTAPNSNTHFWSSIEILKFILDRVSRYLG